MSEMISPSQFHTSEGVEAWRVVGDGATTFFATSSYRDAARLVEAVARIEGVEDHAGIDVRRGGVTIRLLTKSTAGWGMSTTDVEIARAITQAARELGLTGDPSAVSSLLVVAGASDITAIMPFWRAALGYTPRPDSPDEDLVDPGDRWPGFWFEQMKEPRGDGGGAIHVAVWLPPEQARARVDGALAAGGHLVRDRFAPAWWTLADAAGNEVDISTVETRDEGVVLAPEASAG
jgi:4a-hydroxytetrahydrobiopterin dehydratase